MPSNDDDIVPPKKQLEVARGGASVPPRPTAVGLADFGEFRRRGIGKVWNDFFVLFNRMTRVDQERLLVRICQVVTVSLAVVLTVFFYQFVPPLVKVLALPLFFVGSWLVATNVVSPIVIAQLEGELNPAE